MRRTFVLPCAARFGYAPAPRCERVEHRGNGSGALFLIHASTTVRACRARGWGPAQVNMVRIDVDTPARRYAVTLDEGLLDRLPRLLDDVKAPARRFIVSSPLVW